jgi:hypothetical protein
VRSPEKSDRGGKTKDSESEPDERNMAGYRNPKDENQNKRTCSKSDVTRRNRYKEKIEDEVRNERGGSQRNAVGGFECVVRAEPWRLETKIRYISTGVSDGRSLR